MLHKFLCQLTILVMIAFPFPVSQARASGANAPRMWRVSYPGDKNGTLIYILAISHSGSALEYDTYLDARVVPAFLSADVLQFEDGGKLATNDQPECERSLSNPAG